MMKKIAFLRYIHVIGGQQHAQRQRRYRQFLLTMQITQGITGTT